jgi:tetratricopeptide (TPR) repeat protein
MKSGNRWFLAVVLALMAWAWFGAPCFAQKSDVSALTAQISELSRAGKTSQAIPLAQRLLANMEKAHGPVDRDVAAALNNLALLYENQGRDADAEPLYRRALAILEKLDGLDDSEIAPELNNLATLYQRQGRYAEAEPLFKRSLAIREKALGRDHPDVAQSLNNLRQLEKSDGRAAEAEPVIRRSLAIREKVFGNDHPDVARSLNNLADLYERLGRGPTPNRSISGHWRSASARWVPIILTSRPRWAIWPPSTRHRDAPGIHCRWCNARSQAAGRNCARLFRCCSRRNGSN